MPMPGPESLQIMGYILLALALPVLAWAVLGDPSRGRLRCPKCWYRMEGTSKQETGWICPECGRKVAKERGLTRARRRWRWAVPSLLAIVVAGQMWQQPARANERLQTRWIPTTALVIAPTRVAWLSWIDEAVRARELELPYWIWLVIDWNDWRRATTSLRSIAYTRERWPVGVEPVVWLRTVDPALGFFEARDLSVEWLDGADLSSVYAISRWRGISDPPPWLDPARAPQKGLRVVAAAAPGRQKIHVRISLSGARGKYSCDQVIEYQATETVNQSIAALDWPGSGDEVRAGTECDLITRSWYANLFVRTKPASRWSHLDYQVMTDEGSIYSVDPLRGFSMRPGAEPLRRPARLIVFQDPVLTLQRYPDATSYWPGTVEIPFSDLLSR